MKIDGVIFDCDGTLVDSEGLAVEIVLELLAEAGVRLSAAELMPRFHGRRFATVVDELCQAFPVLDAQALTAHFRARTPVVFRQRLKAMPGALALVSGLEIEKCVASNGPVSKIETCLAVTGLLPHFEGRIVSAFEVEAWKPDPRLIEVAAQRMGVAIDRCLLVEDSLPGVQAGLTAGARVVAYRMSDLQLGALVGRVTRIDELSDLQALL
ncbi:HAD-IA family hydrolase [Thauera humireducens]|uniref:Sugar transferase n=1 Tax=Thauera humireducens TaxID=1134435 RepID=A0A127K997_9RHOO|nr:HAD-IA family hydrolase [Thauera humireducens]AMO38492.1 hypothetical protein AC731_017010 [Thauera humireducens]